MSNPEILSLISIGTTAIVGIILYKQIRSQQQIINQYKDLLQTLDLNKIKEFHELDKRSILATATIQIDNHYKEMESTFGRQYDEMASYIADQLLHLEKEQRNRIIKQLFPNCQQIFRKHFEELEGEIKEAK